MRHPVEVSPAATVSVSSEQVLNALPPVTKTFLEGMLKQIHSPIEATTRANEFDLVSDMWARIADRFPVAYAHVLEFPELPKITPSVALGFRAAAMHVCPSALDPESKRQAMRKDSESMSDQWAAMAHLLRNHAEQLRMQQDVAFMPSRG